MLSSILFIIVSVYIGLSLLLYVFQPGYVYFPTRTISITPQAIGLDYKDVHLTADSGEKIHGWFIPANTSQGYLLFLHGNGGNISHRLDSLKIFHDLDLSVLIIDYRGYGLSDGKPSEKASYEDARLAWDYLTQVIGARPEQIILFGRSLGATIATQLATQIQARALILESSFMSVKDMAKHYYPYLPVHLITRIKYPAIDYLEDIRIPVLVVHSPDDEIVPYEHGLRLFERARPPKSFLEIRGGHNEGFYASGQVYTDGLRRFLNQYL